MRALGALIVVLVATAPAAAEDGPRLFIPEVRQVEELSDASGKAFALLGRVVLDVPGRFRLRARNVVIWLHPDADTTVFGLVRGAGGDEESGIPLWAVRGVYAEGGGVPAVFQAGGRIFRCSSLYYDLSTHRGILLTAEIRVLRNAMQPPLPDLLMRAAEFRARRPGEWHGRDVVLTASPAAPAVGRPATESDTDMQLEVRRVVLTDEATAREVGRLVTISSRDYRDGRGPTRAEIDAVLADVEKAATDPNSKVLKLERITGRLLGIPIFRFRKLESTGGDVLPLRVVADVGGNGRLGNGVYLGVGMRTKPVGWFVGAGYYSGRGPLIDGELTLAHGRVSGVTKAAYFHDSGNDEGIVPPSEDRYWVQNRYRFEIDERWRLDGELTFLRDDEWLRTYDEAEAKEGKDQESLLYLRYRGERGYATLTTKVRTIEFQDEVEELPVLRASVPVLTLVTVGETSLQLAVDFEVGNFRHLMGDGRDDAPDFRTYRVDLEPTFFVPFDVGPVRVVAFVTPRLTGWDDDLVSRQAGRFAGTAGVRADLRVARWYGSVLHVMNFAVSYEDLFSLTEPASRFFGLDDTDGITTWEGLLVRWRHRLQRRTKDGLRTFLSLELLGAWFPDRQQPLGRTGDGYLELDADWWATEELLVLTRLEVDTDRGEIPTGSVESWWQARENLWFGVGFRHLEGDSDIITASTEFEVQTRWHIVVFTQYDFKNRDGLDQGILFQRLGRTAVIGVRLKIDPGDGGFSIGLKLDLLHSFRKKQQRRRENQRNEIGWR